MFVDAVGRIKDRLRLQQVLALAFISAVVVSADPSAASAEPCPNEAFRTGPSASLPDCRAYELVTPPDTNGRLVSPLNTFAKPFVVGMYPTELSSPARDSFVYMMYSSPLLAPGQPGGVADVYEAERGGAGWMTTRQISPPGNQALFPVPTGVSSDHLYATTMVEEPAPLSLGFETDYLDKPGGTFELTGKGSMGDEPFAQSRFVSNGGKHVIFSTGHDNNQSRWCFFAPSSPSHPCKVRKLESDAAPEGTGTVYDRAADGPTHVISLLPGNVPQGVGQEAFYKGTSKDASSVAFAIGGTLYVRVDNGEPSEETEEVATGSPAYAGLSEDGRYLFYVAGGESGTIHRFDTTDESDVEVNPTAEGEVVNVSADGSHVYFISEEEINGEGISGEPNLYVWRGSTPEYISTVAPSDLVRTSGTASSSVPALTRWTSYAVAVVPPQQGEPLGPGSDSSRATPNGNVLVFESRAKLTGYENEGHTEIYRWDDIGKELTCVSCNPSGDPATADAHLQELQPVEAPIVIHNLSDDGTRVFFETNEALVERDSDQLNDVYEWQKGGGLGSSIGLISSGQSASYPPPPIGAPPMTPKPNVLFAITPDGNDVFFFSQDVLVPGAGEGGVQAVYDARVEGGFPVPAAPAVCLEESCKPLPSGSSPSLTGPQSEATNGRGNIKPRKHHRRCRHGGRHKKKGHCKHSAKRAQAKGSSAVSSAQAASQPGAGSPPSEPSQQQVSRSASSASPSPVTAANPFEEFGIESVEAGSSTAVAGSHPNLGLNFVLNHHFEGAIAKANSNLEQVSIALPPGLLGNPVAIPRCKTGQFLAFGNCPVASQIGVTKILATLFAPGEPFEPIYNLEPAHPGSEVARFGINLQGYIIFIDVKVRTESDYGVTTIVHSAPGQTQVIAAETTIWGDPSDSSHDEQRMTPPEAAECSSVRTACRAGGRVQQFSPEGTFLSGFSTYETEGVELFEAHGIATDGSGNVWVADTGNNRIQEFQPDGTFIRAVGSEGSGNGQFRSPQGIATDGSGNVWVADTRHNRIQEFQPDGTFIRAVGSEGSGNGQFLSPRDVNVAPNGSVLTLSFAGKRRSGISPTARKAFLSNPSPCQEGAVGFSFKSYQLPGQEFSRSAPFPPITDCTGLPFAPTFEAQPTSHAAGAPTGLDTVLTMPQHEGPEERATATMREARVTLPAGMQVAAGAANWIGTCSDAQVGFHEEVDANCPNNSKLGTVTIKSPALSVPIEGNVFQRAPSPGHQLALWLVVDALGLHVKIPGELESDPNTGRVTAVFRDLPQVPVSEIDLNVWGGPRAPLKNPGSCGKYTTDYALTPHSSDPVVTGQSQMTIDQGCNQGFDPRLHAGVTNPVAGKFSPLIVDLTREDGQQDLHGFELELPDGELAKLKGVPLCPDSAASAGSCPADSAIGHVVAAAGPGPEPLWVPQPGKAEPRVYLAGPYQGNPYSVVTIVPAQAGPFDLGNVVVRSGINLDPDTNRAVIKADPLPQFFEGVGLTYRRLHVVVDRPEFSLNPTDCREMQVDSTVTSTQGAVAHPASRFKVNGCKRLKFKPKLSLKLEGGTKRADYPALTAVLKARKGDANIARTSVGLPHSEFLAQEHIVTICTRKQFAADKCPKGSVYGKAKAFTPLLAKPLSGPVYLRSSDHPLPDMVVALGGELDVNLVGRIDSHDGGIRATFEAVPDAPVTKFVLQMRGGKKSLLTNSTDICRGKHRATVKMRAQNGRAFASRPVLAARCGRKR